MFVLTNKDESVFLKQLYHFSCCHDYNIQIYFYFVNIYFKINQKKCRILSCIVDYFMLTILE